MSLISEHYDEIIDAMKKRRPDVPDYYYQLNAAEKEVNQIIMDSMNKKINFLKNPRFRGLDNAINFADADELATHTALKECPFRPNPEFVKFDDYEIDKIYQARIKLVNVDKVSRRLKFIPPGTPEFSLIDVKYPVEKEGLIAPGNSVIFEVLFRATSLADYSDQLMIITEKDCFKIPLIAKREQPMLDLPPVIECESCWIGKKSVSQIPITNKGGHAGFWIDMPGHQGYKMDSFDDPEEVKIGSFRIWPNKFYLRKGETAIIYVNFEPENEGEEEIEITLKCDNMQDYTYKMKSSANMIELGISKI